jgi:hypothetical protein
MAFDYKMPRTDCVHILDALVRTCASDVGFVFGYQQVAVTQQRQRPKSVRSRLTCVQTHTVANYYSQNHFMKTRVLAGQRRQSDPTVCGWGSWCASSLSYILDDIWYTSWRPKQRVMYCPCLQRVIQQRPRLLYEYEGERACFSGLHEMPQHVFSGHSAVALLYILNVLSSIPDHRVLASCRSSMSIPRRSSLCRSCASTVRSSR